MKDIENFFVLFCNFCVSLKLYLKIYFNCSKITSYSRTGRVQGISIFRLGGGPAVQWWEVYGNTQFSWGTSSEQGLVRDQFRRFG